MHRPARGAAWARPQGGALGANGTRKGGEARRLRGGAPRGARVTGWSGVAVPVHNASAALASPSASARARSLAWPKRCAAPPVAGPVAGWHGLLGAVHARRAQEAAASQALGGRHAHSGRGAFARLHLRARAACARGAARGYCLGRAFLMGARRHVPDLKSAWVGSRACCACTAAGLGGTAHAANTILRQQKAGTVTRRIHFARTTPTRQGRDKCTRSLDAPAGG